MNSPIPNAGTPPEGGAPKPPRSRHPDTTFESALSNIRHSLRTPLNQIIGYSEMLQEEAGEQGLEAFLPDLQRLHDAGGQLLALVNENLSTPRVASGKLDLDQLRRDGRTLLNLIIGYSELCQEEAQQSGRERFRDDLRKIQSAANHLQAMLDDEALLAPLQQVRPPGVRTAEPVLERAGRTVATSAGTAATGPATVALTGRLLIVDDNEGNRDMLSRRLERLGHTLLMAENGRQAIDLLRTNPVDLILLDLIMPEMDGVETLERLKADDHLRYTPVIMLSALDELDRVVRCIEIGADDYLQKPFNPVLLNARINACLEKKRWRDQEQAFLEQIQIEREKSDHLLLNILPQSIADRLKQGETTIADDFADVTVLFADLVEFTKLAARVPAKDLVRLLNDVFSQFDWLAELHHLEKIKTIGDAYMVVGGLPKPRADHASAVAEMALDMLKVVTRLNARGGLPLNSPLSLRLGICTGSVTAGIIGSKKFIYDLWGDTVNIASRMESHGAPGAVQVTESTYLRLKDRYVFERRGQIEVKGKGQMTTYFLTGRNIQV